MSNSPTIALQSVTKKYRVGRKKVQVLDIDQLSINQGEFVAITGASGSGKSTLLQIIGGLDKATSGDVIVQGKSINRLRDRALSRFRNQTIGFVFQFFYLQPHLNIRQNIELAAMPSTLKRQPRRRKAQDLADKVGLGQHLKYLPRKLSGGQIQRVAIARALINNPSIIVADEPTGNLDSTNSHEVIDLFIQLRQETGATVIIATHDSDIAARADRIIEIKDGAIV